MTIGKRPTDAGPGFGTLTLTLNALGIGPELEEEVVDELSQSSGIPLILASGLPVPRGLVLEEASAYLLVYPHVPADTGQLLRIDRQSGVIQALATMSRPGELVGHERSLYWTEPDAGEVRRLHRQGGRIVTLASDQQAPAHLGVGDAGVFWATRSFEIVRAHADSAAGVVLAHFGTPITGLVVDGLDVLVALQSGELWRVPGAGGQTVRVLRAQRLTHGFVSDGTRLYWIDDKEGALKSASKSGSMIERVTSASTGPTCLALTREEIIWSEADAGTIQCIAKQGSWASTAIAAELPVPGELAVAGSWIAWINRADGSVMALRR